MEPEKRLHSLGHLSQILQKSPAIIREALTAAGVAPEVSINGIDHFAEDDAFRVLTSGQQPVERRSRRK